MIRQEGSIRAELSLATHRERLPGIWQGPSDRETPAEHHVLSGTTSDNDVTRYSASSIDGTGSLSPERVSTTEKGSARPRRAEPRSAARRCATHHGRLASVGRKKRAFFQFRRSRESVSRESPDGILRPLAIKALRSRPASRIQGRFPGLSPLIRLSIRPRVERPDQRVCPPVAQFGTQAPWFPRGSLRRCSSFAAK